MHSFLPSATTSYTGRWHPLKRIRIETKSLLKPDKKSKPKSDEWKFYTIMAFIILYCAYFMYFGPDSRERYLALGVIYMIMGFTFLARKINQKKRDREKKE